MKNLNYSMDHILYQIFKIILNIYLKKHGKKTVNSSIRIYTNKIENGISLKTKSGHYLKLLTPETMKLLGSKQKVTKGKDGENVPYLEITEVVLIHCNIANNSYQQNLRAFYIFIPNKSLG